MTMSTFDPVAGPGGRDRLLDPGRERVLLRPDLDHPPHAQLPAPLPGQPGPFSLGAPGALENALTRAGFDDVAVHRLAAPLLLPSTADCVRFERESFGALHQMLAGLDPAAREQVWTEIAERLAGFDGPAGFTGPCEMLVAVGGNPDGPR